MPNVGLHVCSTYVCVCIYIHIYMYMYTNTYVTIYIPTCYIHIHKKNFLFLLREKSILDHSKKML